MPMKIMENNKRISSLYKRSKQMISNMKISYKIACVYLLLIVVSTVFSGLIFNRIYYSIVQREVSKTSLQTLESIQANVYLIIENAANYSKMILADSNLQTLLRKGSIFSDLNLQSHVGTHLYKLLQSVSSISSVYIYDNSGNIYSVGIKDLPSVPPTNIKTASWYDEVIKKEGGYILRRNGGGVDFEKPGRNYISLIRLIRDIEDMKHLGILIINIPEEVFAQAYANSSDNLPTYNVILDENNRVVFNSEEFQNGNEKTIIVEYLNEIIDQVTQELNNRASGTMIRHLADSKYLISYLGEDKYNWKFIRMIPFTNIPNRNATIGAVALVVIILNGFLIFLFTIGISRIITVPINHLLNSMKYIEKGIFREVNIKTYSQEFYRLCQGYNIMISKIQELIQNIIDKQRLIRKVELNALMAQIKPHLLYNTLDSIHSLALSGKNDEVCELVEALGSFYRNCVSNGKEIITIGEEIAIVKNYLKIQKIRYPNLFEVVFSIDESCNSYRIPKLTLQPLVENALYHGIRAQGKPGTIIIGVERVDKKIRLWIEDDGKGMSEEQVEKIMSSDIEGSKNGFGLKGTMERINIFTGRDDSFKITSRPGEGTRIEIIIEATEREDMHWMKNYEL